MKCQYCNNIFSTKPNLINHQKSAKYCLKLREDTEPVEFRCHICDKVYTSNYRLSSHLVKCMKQSKEVVELRNENQNIKKENIRLTKQLQDRNTHIKELEDKLENIALKAVSRPTNNNKTQINTYIQNMQPVTNEHLVDNAQHLTIEHIKKGVEGYAEYALEYPLKDRLLCSDYSRRKVKFKDNDGNVITDPEMTSLTKKFFKSIKDKNKELICKSANELKERLGDDNVMDTVVKLFDYKEMVNRGSDGEKTDFHHDFVRQVCSQTLKE